MFLVKWECSGKEKEGCVYFLMGEQVTGGEKRNQTWLLEGRSKRE